MKVCILGAGAYGLCLAVNIIDKANVTVWTKFESEKNNILSSKKSDSIPGTTIDNRILISTNMSESIKDASLIIVAVPSCNVREVIVSAKEYITDNQHICIASKGIENDTLKFMYDIVNEIINTPNIAIISGPGFASDIANKVPVGLSLASLNKDTVNLVKEVIENQNLSLYETDDLIGVQLCGCIKNVLAIASGILVGLGYPISTQALFLTNSINSINDLIIKLCGNKNTITSLAGIGDIYLTCSSTKSRNFTFGKMIGSKLSKYEIDSYVNKNNVEGLYALKSIFYLLKKENINIPLINVLYEIIYNDKNACNIIKTI